MKTGRNSQEEFDASGEAHDVVNAEAVDMTPPKQPEKQYTSFNPLTSEPVNEKSYAKPNAKISEQEANTPIPEPVFMPPPINAGTQGAAGGAPKPPPPPVNPAMAELDEKNKSNAAKHAAQMCMQTYEWLHDVANKQLPISKRKIQKLERDGKINLGVPMPMPNGQQITVGQYIQLYNSQQEEVFIVSQKFKDDVIPLLEEIFKKKGIGMTPEQQLMYLVGQDLVVKAAIAMDLVKIKRQSLKLLEEMTIAYKKGVRPVQQQPQEQPQPQYQQQAAPPEQPMTPPPPQHTYQQQPAYTPPPAPPEFPEDEDDENAIPFEEVKDITNEEIPEPEYDQQEPSGEDMMLIGEGKKPKRAYKKREPKTEGETKNPAHRPRGKRNKLG